MLTTLLQNRANINPFITMLLLLSTAMNVFASVGSVDHGITQWCTQLSKELRSVNYDRCIARKWESKGHSNQGRMIPSLSWGDPQGQKVMVIGAIHGDEISSVSLVFRWLDFLERTKHDSDLRKPNYLFIPLANPDGFFAKPRTRTNSNKIDLNRNFATKTWTKDAIAYWKKRTNSDPRRYPGQSPASEVETKVLQTLMDEFKPDLVVSVHAPYCLVDHDGPIEFPELKSPLPVRALGAYPGSLGTYAGIDREIPVVTPELPSAKQMPDQKAIEQLLLFIMRSKY